MQRDERASLLGPRVSALRWHLDDHATGRRARHGRRRGRRHGGTYTARPPVRRCDLRPRLVFLTSAALAHALRARRRRPRRDDPMFTALWFPRSTLGERNAADER